MFLVKKAWVKGTVLLVSHPAWFCSTDCTGIVEKSGKVIRSGLRRRSTNDFPVAVVIFILGYPTPWLYEKLEIDSLGWTGRDQPSKVRKFWRIGSGSLFCTPRRKSWMWTMSYWPISCSENGAKQSSLWIETFDGSHSLGGHCEISMSNPSMWAEDGRYRARLISQMLIPYYVGISRVKQ